MNSPSLADPLQIGPTYLPHRVLLAPMTRMRAVDASAMPTDLMREFYSQRASAGLTFTEGTQISPQSKGYARTPGIYTAEQVYAWRQITEAVHAAGGRIVIQLLHVGRVSHRLLLDGRQPASASALPFDDWVTIEGQDGGLHRLDCEIPQAMTRSEIGDVVRDYAHATTNAREAGFDMVELHAAHGYLLHQFLATSTNLREDNYGGTIVNRARFALDALDAIIGAWDAEHVGMRVSPSGTFCGLTDPDGESNVIHLARHASQRAIAYVHLSEPDWNGCPPLRDGFRADLRAAFDGPIIAAGGYTADKARAVLEEGTIDAVAFGRSFAANPDLPARLRDGLALNTIDRTTLYEGGARGYTDYHPVARSNDGFRP